MNQRKLTSKFVPMRTCIACRTEKAKADLVRLVRTEDNDVRVDHSGRLEGRGAYLCRDMACWESGLKGSYITHALKIAITPENCEEQLKYGREVCEVKENGREDK